MSNRTTVVGARLPNELVEKLNMPQVKEHKQLLLRILLEDYFAGKLFISKIRFENEKKTRSANAKPFLKRA